MDGLRNMYDGNLLAIVIAAFAIIPGNIRSNSNDNNSNLQWQKLSSSK